MLRYASSSSHHHAGWSPHVRWGSTHNVDHLTSWKASRAWAQRLSLRAAAATMVCTAFCNKLRSSKVSTRSLRKNPLLKGISEKGERLLTSSRSCYDP